MTAVLCYNCLRRLLPTVPIHINKQRLCFKPRSSSIVFSVNSILTNGAVRFSSVEVAQKHPRSSKTKKPTHEDYPFMPLLATQHVYVLHDGLAGQIVKAMKQAQVQPCVPVLESNPGPGIVTRKLFKAGLKQVIAVEALEGFIPYLKKLQQEVGPKALAVFQWQYAATALPQWNPDAVYEHPKGSLTSLISGKKDQYNKPPLSVLSLVPHLKERAFFMCLLNQWVAQQGLFALCQPEWFVLISADFYQSLVVAAMDENRPTKKFTNLAIILQLVFDIQLCTKLPEGLFTPPFPQKRRKTKAHAVLPDLAENMRYLVRFRQHPQPLISTSELTVFSSFLKQLLQKRKDRIIPKMEKLIPGCGIHLILMGVSMMKKTGDLPIHLAVDIFRAMQTWPEYEGSPMKQHLSQTAGSMHDEEPTDDS
ncbi:hypothetical protein BaRGS_00016415 [Batillaria attramentaria]|uniref:rRNA adenine N(6)-methyltransferase n=1 Tax=Batillaria attramentaria TaxID=370345 RepID=A0ABD0KZG8_9CAEN